MDVVFGLGVRQEFGEAGIFALSYLMTPPDLEFWSDPYIEGADRAATNLDFPGFRIRWGSIFGTGLELTFTDRFYQFEKETSGDWLISENRLDPEQQPLLNRDGDVFRFQALYRIDHDQHRFEPAIRFVKDDHKGGAIANRGMSFQFTYIYRTPRLILDANLVYGFRDAKDGHPIYDTVVNTRRFGAGLAAFMPVMKFSSSVLMVTASADYFRESTNVDFYNSNLTMLAIGVLWRHLKK